MMWWIAFFFMAGIVLILAEFILPGLVCGVLGGAFLVVSCGLALYTFPQHGLFVIFGEGLAAILCIGLGFYYFPRSVVGRAMILADDQPQDAGWVSDLSDASLKGVLGEVFTDLRPAGTVTINGKRVNAVSSGEYIESGVAVRVIEVHGNRVVVEEAAKS
jgi:membrane-bound serine protease (ClpP class)